MDKQLPKTDVDIRSIRTFQDDMAQTIEKEKESAISISVKESERKQKEGVRTSPVRAQKSASRTALTFMSIFFLIGGFFVLGYFWWQSRPVTNERVIIDTLVIADTEVTENIDSANRDSLISFIRSQEASQKNIGTVTHLNFTHRNIASEEGVDAETFLRTLEAHTPSALVRSMDGDMMFGTIQLQESAVPFWIVEVDSFENAFGGMLSWENLLQEDLGSVFSTNELALTPVFTDVISRNKDTRVLYNDLGQEILLYTFLDKNTLLITENEKAFTELLPLFISSKQIR